MFGSNFLHRNRFYFFKFKFHIKFPFLSIYLPESSKIEQIVNGSIRSASTVSSRDCDRNASLVR